MNGPSPKGFAMASKKPLVWLCRALVLTSALLIWEVGVRTNILPEFFFGTPAAVAAVIWNWFLSGKIYHHLAITLFETILAFVIGTLSGFVVGLWLALRPFAAAVFDPFIKALNSMPRLILAPIFAIWFGLGIWSKVALGVTIVFFNVYQGAREVSPILLSNSRMLGANQRQLISSVYVPAAMSWVFSSLHLSVGMAFVGAVIGEYLGSSAGVGYLILEAESTFQIDTVFAGIIVLTCFALVLDYLVTIAEGSLLRWRA
jgi:NitT/TauT family transport system permease protein